MGENGPFADDERDRVGWYDKAETENPETMVRTVEDEDDGCSCTAEEMARYGVIDENSIEWDGNVEEPSR